MTTVYFTIRGFTFYGGKNKPSDKFFFIVHNNISHFESRKHIFTCSEGNNMSKRFHINIRDLRGHNFSILLYKKTMMRNVLYARVDIPTFQLPFDKVTNNFLPMVAQGNNFAQTICQVEIHLTTDKKEAYDAPSAEPVLKQANYDTIIETCNTDENADIYSNLLVQ